MKSARWKIAGCVLFFSAAALAAGEKPLLEVIRARPDKILYDEKAPVRVEIAIKNNSQEAKRALVRGSLEWEIDRSTPPQEAQIAIAAGETATAALTWPEAPGKFGHAVKIEVALDGNIIWKGEDYFQVCNDYWEVALIAAVGFIWSQFDNFKPRSDFKWADEMVETWRQQYFNGFEKFFWAPDDFLEMTPDEEIWWSGQARYLETKAGLKALIERGHNHGMKA
ncbi:MAG: hypothetical protein N3A66_02605, partial [Planctomycetota bacterium]|nr:hypothetical protein [Planctomycetota bacterium]